MFRAGKEYKVRHDLNYLPRDVRGRTFEVIRDTKYARLYTLNPAWLDDDTEVRYKLIKICPSECEEVIKR